MASEEQGESLHERKTREFEEDQEKHADGYCSSCGKYMPSQLDADGLCYDCRMQQCMGCGKEFQPEELDENGLCSACRSIPKCTGCGRAMPIDENGLCADCRENNKDGDGEDENENKDENKQNNQTGLDPEHASQIADSGSQSYQLGAQYVQQGYYNSYEESISNQSAKGSEQGDDEEDKKDAKDQEIAAEVNATQAGLNASAVTSDGGKGGQICNECGQPAAVLTNGVCQNCMAQHQEEGTSTCPVCGNLLDQRGGPCPHCKTNSEDPNNPLYKDPNESAAASAYKDDIGRDDQGNLVGTGLKADAVDGQNSADAGEFSGRDQFGGGQHQNIGTGGGQGDSAEKDADDSEKGGKRDGDGGIQNPKGQEAEPKGGKEGKNEGKPPPEGWFRWLETNWNKMVKNEKTKALCIPVNRAVHTGLVATAVGAALVVYPGFNTDTVGALFNLLNDLENPLIYTSLIFAGSNAIIPILGPFLLGLPSVLLFSGMSVVEILRNTIEFVLKLPPANAVLLSLKKAVDELKPKIEPVDKKKSFMDRAVALLDKLD